MTFQVNRQTWLRGEGANYSYLRRPSDGKMCCLGHFSVSCGVSEEEITGNCTLDAIITCGKAEMPSQVKALATFRQTANESEARQDERGYRIVESLMEFNDAPLLSDEQREKVLTEKFALAGIKVEFIN